MASKAWFECYSHTTCWADYISVSTWLRRRGPFRPYCGLPRQPQGGLALTLLVGISLVTPSRRSKGSASVRWSSQQRSNACAAWITLTFRRRNPSIPHILPVTWGEIKYAGEAWPGLWPGCLTTATTLFPYKQDTVPSGYLWFANSALFSSLGFFFFKWIFQNQCSGCGMLLESTAFPAVLVKHGEIWSCTAAWSRFFRHLERCYQPGSSGDFRAVLISWDWNSPALYIMGHESDITTITSGTYRGNRGSSW